MGQLKGKSGRTGTRKPEASWGVHRPTYRLRLLIGSFSSGGVKQRLVERIREMELEEKP
ncbi:MAG TPA: hypothetical protein VMW87_04550 [Spirochaetia bacterium]|nr:hypothetical protein [Spirochaetia bacterium]